MKKIFPLALLITCIIADIAYAGSVYKIILKNGKTITADEIEQDEASVTLLTQYGWVEIPNSDIRSITKTAVIEEKKPAPVQPEQPKTEPASATPPQTDESKPAPAVTTPENPADKHPETTQPVPPAVPEVKIAESAPEPEKITPPPLPETGLTEKNTDQLRIDVILQALAAKENIDDNLKELSKLAEKYKPYMLQIIDTDSGVYAYWSAFALSKLNVEIIGDAFLKRINHADSNTRGLIISKLGSWTNNAAVRETIKNNFPLELTPAVKLRYIYCIKDLRIMECLDGLFQCLENTDQTVRTKARETIVYLNKHAGKSYQQLDLAGIINDKIALSSSDEYLLELIRLIGDLQAPEYYESLKKMTEKKSELITMEVIKALKKFQDKSLTLFFMTLYEEEHSEKIRIALIKAIEKTKDTRAVDFLIEQLAGISTPELIKDASMHALENITKQNFNYDVEQWRSWWKKMTSPEAVNE